jgi:signal transduction histidine kinase
MIKRIPFQYRITILYVFFSALWILFSDKLVFYLIKDTYQIERLSTYKGWLFVLVTGILLYYLIRKEILRRTQIVDELLESNKKAEESDRLKTTFLSNLSHYIRTPMNGILGFVELLEDRNISLENHQVFLSYINEMSQNLLQTLNSIIEISKIQEGQVNINVEPFNAKELIDRIAEAAKFDISAKKKSIRVVQNNSFFNENDSIISDREKISHVLSNLVSNAVNFTDEGEIEIGSSKNNGDIVFWIKDTGKGIPEGKIDVLSTGFLNSTSTTCTIGEGAGLGLPLSSGLIKLLGGNLWLESTGKEGSKFCFSIPVKPS